MLVNYLHFLLFALFFSECLEECAIAQTLENCLTKSFSQPSPSFRFCSWIDAFTRCVCVLSGCVPLSLRLVLRCCCRAGSTESSSSFFRTPDTQYLSCKQRHGCEILPTSHALFHWNFTLFLWNSTDVSELSTRKHLIFHATEILVFPPRQSVQNKRRLLLIIRYELWEVSVPVNKENLYVRTGSSVRQAHSLFSFFFSLATEQNMYTLSVSNHSFYCPCVALLIGRRKPLRQSTEQRFVARTRFTRLTRRGSVSDCLFWLTHFNLRNS